MGLYQYIRNTIPGFTGIFKLRTPFSKKELFFTYLRLKCKQIILAKILRSRPQQESFFGFTVNFFDHSMFLYLFEEIFIRQEYFFLSETSQPVIIDCGSNIGLSIIFFKKLYPDSKIIAFEPDIQTYELLLRNVQQNNFQNVNLYNKALAKSKGTVDFYYDPKEPGSPRMSIHKDRASAVFESVETDILSDYISGTIDFLKMDIEGSEYQVVGEIAAKGKLKYIKEMAIEYHHHINPDEDNCSAFLKMLEDHNLGYQITTSMGTPLTKRVFQDLIIYAYRK